MNTGPKSGKRKVLAPTWEACVPIYAEACANGSKAGMDELLRMARLADAVPALLEVANGFVRFAESKDPLVGEVEWCKLLDRARAAVAAVAAAAAQPHMPKGWAK